MRIFLLAAFVSFTCFSINSSAQQFGGTPPSQRWRQINTDTARIIFAEGMDSTAQRVASIVHQLAANQPVSLGSQLHKINIVLQHQTTIGNGYVGLGPFRSEFYMTPVRDNFSEGSVPWGDQLATHEYRHVQQFNNFRRGLSKAAYYVFGEEGLSVAINASVPDWFYEGDAVYNETVMSNQGRGRLPYFLNTYPSLWQENKKYSWMKLRNGSLKDYVPSHYHLGYLLVNYGRKQYGGDFWTKVTQDAAAFKGLFYPFQKAIRKHAGVDYKTFREQAFNSYKTTTERVSTSRDQYLLPVNKHYVTSYEFPYSISADSLIYLKTSYRHRPSFVIKDLNGQHQLRVKDIALDDQFSYRNGKVVYAAYKPDIRWSWRDYSVIKVLDVQTNQQRTITKKTKYFTPDISPGGNRIVAVENAINGKSELHVLDAENGNVLNRIHSADIQLFTDPKFIDDNNLVTAVRLRDGKMALASAEIATGNTMRLTPPSFNVVGYPCVSNGVIYFTASYEGNDDVFAIKMGEDKIYRISDGPLGNYHVNVANGKITWSSFTAEGMQLQQMDEKDIVWIEIAKNSPEAPGPTFPVALPAGTGDILLKKQPPRIFDVSKYRKGTKLFNFHSWRPYYEDPVFTYSIYGENVLNTLQTEVYYLRNENEKTNAVGATATYGGWFPYLSIGTEYTFDYEQQVGNRLWQWDQLDSRIGFTIPLNLTGGRYLRQLNAGSNYFYRRAQSKGFLKDSLGNIGFSYMHYFINWSQQVQRTTQHIFPRLGYGIGLQHRHSLDDVTSWQFFSNGTLYLPGILNNHNLVINAAYQEADTFFTAFREFPNRFPYSRGYAGRYFARMWKVSGNYHFPIWHPDFGFANILYVQRLRGNAFYDFTKVFSRDKSQYANQRSVGFEIYADTKWWNQYELTFGFRVSNLLDRDQFDGFKGTVFEFIMPVSIIPR